MRTPTASGPPNARRFRPELKTCADKTWSPVTCSRYGTETISEAFNGTCGFCDLPESLTIAIRAYASLPSIWSQEKGRSGELELAPAGFRQCKALRVVAGRPT